MPYKYNANTGKWNYTKTNPSANKSNKKSNGGGKPSSSGKLAPPPQLQSVPSKNNGGGGKGGDDKSTKTKKEAVKKFIEVEYNILKGTLGIRPNLKLKARRTIILDGFGKYLSGIYYIESLTNVYGLSGVTQELSVIKNGFGDTMKLKQYNPRILITNGEGKVFSVISKGEVTSKVLYGGDGKTTPVTLGKSNEPKKAVAPKIGQRVHILKNGESLWSLANKYYKDGSKWRVIAKANNISDKEVTRLKNGRKIIIP